MAWFYLFFLTTHYTLVFGCHTECGPSQVKLFIRFYHQCKFRKTRFQGSSGKPEPHGRWRPKKSSLARIASRNLRKDALGKSDKKRGCATAPPAACGRRPRTITARSSQENAGRRTGLTTARRDILLHSRKILPQVCQFDDRLIGTRENKVFYFWNIFS